MLEQDGQERMIETSVIIPTAGKRPLQLRAAIESVSRQRHCGPIEIVIVDDSGGSLDRDLMVDAAPDLKVVTIAAPTDTSTGQRTTGVEAASGRWVAFLDDDDIWEPNKLSEQVRLAEEISMVGGRPVISSRVRHTFEGGGTASGVPEKLIASDEDVSDYLFYQRSPKTQRQSLFTSTLLVERELALEVPWRRMPRHQDWDWILRAARLPGAVFRHHPQELAVIHVGSSGSISATVDWERSLAWAKDMSSSGLMTPRSYSDFLAGQTLRYALGARSLRGVKAALCALVDSRRAPSLRSTLVGLAGMLRRTDLERLMAITRSLRRRGA